MMLGWMILFAMMAVSAGGMALAERSIAVSATSASVVFTALFFLGLLARALRGKS
jgi:hypothetical protein